VQSLSKSIHRFEVFEESILAILIKVIRYGKHRALITFGVDPTS